MNSNNELEKDIVVPEHIFLMMYLALKDLYIKLKPNNTLYFLTNWMETERGDCLYPVFRAEQDE